MVRDLAVEWLGLVPYADGLEMQRVAVEARRRGTAGDRLLLLEHPPVVTLGRSSRLEHLLLSREELAARGVEIHEVGRGGDVTYHAPGQLVGYLILDLEARGAADVHRFLRSIEAGLIDALAELGVPACALPGMTGVFVDRARSRRPRADGAERKLASIGVALRGWVSFHGFALNLSTDLSGFRSIVPCGLRGVEMTSVAVETGGAGEDLAERGRRAVSRAFRGRFS
ncbi:MAG: lipoyl(octanoyl) transferase LipB [Proteobacteria bacterium]|nr:lipoyl(octanoyl) transferase LipB [Pseudomonadota bacterium]